MNETIMRFTGALFLCLATAKVSSYPAPQRRTATLQLAGTSCCGAPIYILAGCRQAYNSTTNNKTQPEESIDSTFSQDDSNEDQCEEPAFPFQDSNCNSTEPDDIDNTGDTTYNFTLSKETANNSRPQDNSSNGTVAKDNNSLIPRKSNMNSTIYQCCPICTCKVNCTNSTCRSVLRGRCCSYCPPNSVSHLAGSGNGCGGNNPVSSLNMMASCRGRPCLLCNSGNGLGGNNITSNVNYIKGGNLLCCSGNGPGSNRIQSLINVISGDSNLISSGDITLLQSLCNLFIGQNCSSYGGSARFKENYDPPMNIMSDSSCESTPPPTGET